MFYVFVLDETHVVDTKIVYKTFCGGNVQVRLHAGHARVPNGGTQHWNLTLLGSGQRMAGRLGNGLSIGVVNGSMFFEG